MIPYGYILDPAHKMHGRSVLAYSLDIRWTWSWPALVGFLMESIGLRQLDKFHAIIGFALKS